MVSGCVEYDRLALYSPKFFYPTLMRTAMSQLQLSARGFHRVPKMSRTIADLVDSPAMQPAPLAEALHLRGAAFEGLGASPDAVRSHEAPRSLA